MEFNLYFNLNNELSYSQLRALFVEYQRQAGRPLEDDIKKEMSGDLQKIFLAISKKTLFFYSKLKLTILKNFFRNFSRMCQR